MAQRFRVKRNYLFSCVAAAFVVGFVFAFQNCGQNMTPISSTNESSSTATTSAGVTSLEPCVAGGCPQDISYIQILIANNNPISFLASGATVQETSVDVAGYCNTGGYPGSHMYYSIQDLAGNIIVPTSPTTGVCDTLGKFHFSVPIGMLSGSNNYALNVTLRAVDSTGVEFDNSLGLNKKQVALSPRSGI